jgi:hypothetical protein
MKINIKILGLLPSPGKLLNVRFGQKAIEAQQERERK